jgi:hypothetical protein
MELAVRELAAKEIRAVMALNQEIQVVVVVAQMRPEQAHHRLVLAVVDLAG